MYKNVKQIKILVASLILSLVPVVSAFAEEETQTWAVVDENGVVQNITVCTESVCGEGGSWNGVVPGTNLRVIRQNNDSSVGGYWGTYDDMSKTFTVDRSCSTCDIWENLVSPGIIRDGILTPPIFEAYEELREEETLNVSQASNLLAYTMSYYQATSLKSTVKLSKNLRKFKKTSRTEKVCSVSKNKILINRSGMCKISLEGKKNKRSTKFKVYK